MSNGFVSMRQNENPPETNSFIDIETRKKGKRTRVVIRRLAGINRSMAAVAAAAAA